MNEAWTVKEKWLSGGAVFASALAFGCGTTSSGGRDRSAAAGTAGTLPASAGVTSGGNGGMTGAVTSGGLGGASSSAGSKNLGGRPGASGSAGSGAPAMGGAGGDGTAGSTMLGNGGLAGSGGVSSGGVSAGGGAGAVAGAAGNGVGGAATTACSAVSDFATWPSGAAPLNVGKLAVADFNGHTGDDYGGAGYSLVLSWQGSLEFNLLTAGQAANDGLIKAFDPYLNGTKTVDNPVIMPGTDPGTAVDEHIFGALPLEIGIETHDDRYTMLGLSYANAQWAYPSASGITSDARYWIDDMYMITGLQVTAYRATQDTMYLDRAANTMLAYLPVLQKTPDKQPGSLFWHINSSQYTSKAYWGRANGWVASGMTELLLELPTGDTRSQISAAYQKQIDALLPLQITGGADDGCWRQVLDLSSAPAETSSTAMFTFALVTGVRNGWLTDPKYAQAARRGWLALVAKTNDKGELASVCPGTGSPQQATPPVDKDDLAGQQQFYVAQMASSQVGDQHGQAALMWAAYALLRPDCPGVR